MATKLSGKPAPKNSAPPKQPARQQPRDDEDGDEHYSRAFGALPDERAVRDAAGPKFQTRKRGKEVEADVTPIETGFDGWQLREVGISFRAVFPADSNGDPIIPPWCVLTKDFVPPEPPGMPGKVRGGASGMPQL